MFKRFRWKASARKYMAAILSLVMLAGLVPLGVYSAEGGDISFGGMSYKLGDDTQVHNFPAYHYVDSDTLSFILPSNVDHEQKFTLVVNPTDVDAEIETTPIDLAVAGTEAQGTFKITSSNGEIVKTYSFSVMISLNNNANLGGNSVFYDDPSLYVDYYWGDDESDGASGVIRTITLVNVASDASLKLDVFAADSQATIEGVNSRVFPIQLTGGTATQTFTITAADGTSTKDYTVHFRLETVFKQENPPAPSSGDHIIDDLGEMNEVNTEEPDEVAAYVEEVLFELFGMSEWEDETVVLETAGVTLIPGKILEILYAYGEEEGEHIELTFEYKIEDGVTVTLLIDTSELEGETADFDMNFTVSDVFEDFSWNLPDAESLIEVPGQGIVITPATTGMYPGAFTVTIEITAAALEELFGSDDIENLKVWHVTSEGEVYPVLFEDTDGAAPIYITISSASWYILNDGGAVKDDTPKPPIIPPPVINKVTPSGGGQSSGGDSSAPAAPAASAAPAKTMYVVDTGSLNERTGPGTQYGRVGVLPRGTLLEIRQISPDGKWALAHTGTWISMQYLRHVSGPATPGAVTTTGGPVTKWVVAVSGASRLNVRSLAGTSGRIVGTLRRGDVVNVIAINGGWATIAYTKEVPVAYVSAQYIRQQ